MGKNIEIKIQVKEMKTKDGRAFNSYKAVTKNGALVDLKFRKAIKNLPEKNCWIVVDSTKVSEDKTKEYPCWWIEEIIEIKETKVNSEANAKRALEVFGDPDEE